MNKKKGEDIFGILGALESKNVEFKLSFRWNHYKNKIDKSSSKNTTKTICAFLNSLGGTLFIGVKDDGTIVGVESDIRSYHKTNYTKGKDSFRIDIGEKIRQNIGIKVNNSYEIKFVAIENQEIVRIDVFRYKEPVLHLRRDFFVRIANSSKRLHSKREIFEYMQKEFNLNFKSTYELEIYYLSLMGCQKLGKIVVQKRRAIYYSLSFLALISGALSLIYLFIYLRSGQVLLTIFLLLSGILGVRYSIDVSKELDRRSNISIIYKTNISKNLVNLMQFSSVFLFIIAFGGLFYISLLDIYSLLLFSGFSLLFYISYHFLQKRLKLIYRVLDEEFS